MTAVTLPATFQFEAPKVVASLRAQVAAYLTTAENNSWRLPDSVVGAARTAAGVFMATADKLASGGALWQRVVSGEKTAAWWQGLADQLASDIRAANGYIGAALPTLQRLTDEVLSPTLQEFGAEVKGLAESGLDALPWVAAAAIALAVVYLVATFKRG